MATVTQTTLGWFPFLQGMIDDTFCTDESVRTIEPCQFFQMLTLLEKDFKVVAPKGQKSKNINVKVIDGKVEFDETIDVENSLTAQIKISHHKIKDGFENTVKEILGAMSAVEQRLNRELCKEKVDASKKYYLLFYNQSLEQPPIVGGNYLIGRIISPQMGLPFDFIFKDDFPDCVITLQIIYKLSCH